MSISCLDDQKESQKGSDDSNKLQYQSCSKSIVEDMIRVTVLSVMKI